MTIKDSGEVELQPLKKKMGRPPKSKDPVPVEKMGLPVGRDNIVVPQDEVYKLAALGCKNTEIANFFGIKNDTLRRHFAIDLIKGREDMKISLRRAMLNNACTNMNAALQIFLAKNMLGMSDNGEVDTEDNKPLPWRD